MSSPEESNITDLTSYRERKSASIEALADSDIAARVLSQWSHPLFSAEKILHHIASGVVHGESLQDKLDDLIHRALQEEHIVGENDQLYFVFAELYKNLKDPVQSQAVAHTEMMYLKTKVLSDPENSVNRTMTVLTRIVHAHDPVKPHPSD